MPAIITFSLLSILVLAQIQDHPLSEVRGPFNVNLNMSGVNITNTSWIFFGNNSNDVAVFRPAANTLGLWTNAAERLRIDSSGNVGIGTASPTQILEVVKSVGSGGVLFNVSDSSAGGSYISFQDGTGTANNYVPYIVTQGVGTGAANRNGLFIEARPGEDGSDDYGIIFRAQNPASALANAVPFEFRNYGTAIMTITAAGNVGINTTTPNALLNVMTHSTDTKVATNISNYGTGNSFVVEDSAADTTPFVIDNAGNVGIGTSSPASLLHISGTGNLLNVSNGTTSILYVNATGPDGYVGIGTTEANRPGLNVYGGIRTFVHLITSQTGTTASDGSYINAAANGGLQIGNQETSNVTLFVDNDASKGIFIASGGNVGIGTTAPQDLLNVVGGDINITTGNLTINGTDNLVGIVFDDGTFLSTGTSTGAIGWTDDGSTVRLTTSTDRVGIGTTAPNAVLHVMGNATINGSLYVNDSIWQPVYPSDDSLMLYLPFNENISSVSTMYDRSAYGQEGSPTGLDWNASSGWTTGKYGNALKFDGVDDNVDVTTSLSPSYQTTAAAWIKAGTFGSGTVVIAMLNGSAGVDRNYAFQINLNPATSTKATFGITNTSGSSESVVGATTLNTDTWYYIAGSYDGSSLRIYVNGVLDGTASTVGTNTINTLTTGSKFFRIGQAPGNSRFNGTIDEVRVYNRSLSVDEIRVHYLGGLQSHGTITADRFKIVNTTANKIFEINRSRLEYDTSKLVVDSSGNVGIGTASPSSLLHLSGSNNNAMLNISNGTNSILFVNGTLERVGIGTTNPAVKLHLNASSGNTELRIDGVADTEARLAFYEGGTDRWVLKNDGDVNDILTLQSSSVSNILVATQSGNVGIGTTTIASSVRLNISGGDLAVGSLASCNTIDTTANGTFVCGTDTGGANNMTGYGTAGYIPQWENTTALNNSNIFQLGSSVGIGTTNPSSLLTLGTSAPFITLNNTGAGGGAWRTGVGIVINNNVFSIDQGTTGTTRLTIRDGGNVGIGTTSPNQELHVVGDINVTGSVYYGVNVTGIGSDYAEMFEKLHPYENIEAGDIVAIVKGKVTKPPADRASLYMVVTDSAALIGNSGKGDVPVAFIGQVKTKVSGTVNEGDYILADGSSIGYAKPKKDVTFDEFKSKVVGIALEGKGGNGVSRITVAVGVK